MGWRGALPARAGLMNVGENNMSPSASIAANLPYLRRFARALTGSQASGDAYAIAALEAIAADAGSVDRRWSHGRRCTRCSSGSGARSPSTSAGGELAGNATMQAADRTLESLTPLPRVVFLLRSLEGFSVTEIAEILSGRRRKSRIWWTTPAVRSRPSCGPMC